MHRTNSPNVFFGKPFPVETLLYGLPPRIIKKFSEIKKRVRFEKGQLIYDIGRRPESIYVFESGEARLFIHPGTQTRTVRKIASNEVLCLPESVANSRFETGVKTLTSCVCQSIRRDELIRILESEPQFCFNLLGILGTSLHESYLDFTETLFN
jgi:CRP-like cAMP-binding protein